MSKIAIIGSTRYVGKINKTAEVLRELGLDVKVPKFDGEMKTELEIVLENREIIKWADIVVVFWDGASLGTVFDVGMAFALDKPIILAHLNKFSFANLLRQFSNQSLVEWQDILAKACSGLGVLAGGD